MISGSNLLTLMLSRLAELYPEPLPANLQLCDLEITPARFAIAGVSLLGVGLCCWVLLMNNGAKTAYSTLGPNWLNETNARNDKQLSFFEKLLKNPALLTNCVNTSNIICYVVSPALVVSAIHQFNIYDFTVSVLLIVLVFLLLSLTRTVAERLALRNPERLALRYRGFVKTEVAVISPIIRLVDGLAARLVPLPIPQPTPAETTPTPDPENPVLEFGDKVVREIMVPRMDIIAASISSSLEQLLDIIQKTGYSRLPIFRESIDRVVGILYAKDLLRHLRQRLEDNHFDVVRLLRPPYFVPESKTVATLFSDMRSRRVHLALVVDEYGGTAGLVTLEDMLEDIVGDIQDEYDHEMPEYERLNLDEIIVDAGLSLKEVNQFYNTRWSSESVNTIGGFVYDKLARIPRPGDELILDRQGNMRAEGQDLLPDDVAIVVMSVSGQRLRKLRLMHYTSPDPEPANGG